MTDDLERVIQEAKDCGAKLIMQQKYDNPYDSEPSSEWLDRVSFTPEQLLAFKKTTWSGVVPTISNLEKKLLDADLERHKEEARCWALVANERGAKLAMLIDTINCIKHWHDWGKDCEGMVVSAEHVRKLWNSAESCKSEVVAITDLITRVAQLEEADYIVIEESKKGTL